MQRKPGFPVANCSIKMPENTSLMAPESFHCDEDTEQQQRRQQLINFGHSQWGFNNWSWTVTKQELDFVDLSNGKYTAGVVAFVSVVVKTFDIHRENIGYATSVAANKGFAIYKSRKEAKDRDVDEEARAERKRRQRQAQEEFRLRQLAKQQGLDEKQELSRNASAFDKLLMELPSQDVVIEQTGEAPQDGKRPSTLVHDTHAKRRAGLISRLDIVETT